MIREGLVLNTGQGNVQGGRGHGGHSGENSISGKTGIHFKIMAQRVAGLFSSQAGRDLNPYVSPKSLSPMGAPGQHCVDGRGLLFSEAGVGRETSHCLFQQCSGELKSGHTTGGPCPRPGPSSKCASAAWPCFLVSWVPCEKRKMKQGCHAAPQKLLRQKNQPSLERPPIIRNSRGIGAEGPPVLGGQEGGQVGAAHPTVLPG